MASFMFDFFIDCVFMILFCILKTFVDRSDNKSVSKITLFFAARGFYIPIVELSVVQMKWREHNKKTLFEKSKERFQLPDRVGTEESEKMNSQSSEKEEKIEKKDVKVNKGQLEV